MTQQDKDREAFQEYMLGIKLEYREYGFSANDMLDVWMASKARYEPKLTEREAAEIVLIAFDKAYRSGDTYVARNFVKDGIEALRAAGVHFKSDA